MAVKVSAPGKVHLIGEHAVVYGEPAILAAVGLRTHAEAEKSDKVWINDPQMGHNLQWSVKECLDFYHSLKKLWEEGASKKPADFSELFSLSKGANFKKACVGTTLFRLGISQGIKIKLSGDIPSGSGLGSSSALSIAIAKSFAEVYRKRITLERLNEIAYEIEQFAHGMPPGADNSTCCYGGLVWFQKNFKTGKADIISLKKEIPYEMKNFIIVHTGRPEKTTGELVQQVRMLDPEFRNPRMKRIGLLTGEMREALKKKDSTKIKNLINEDWKILSEFGLSTPVADKIIAKIVSIGGAAKLCGGCGGGIMLAYHENLEKLKSVIKKEGFEPMQVELGVEGVRVEN